MALPSRSRCHAEADRLLQPTTLQQRLHARVLAAEVAVQGGEVDGVAAREDLVAEGLAVLAGQATVLLEPFEGVVVEHLGPEVGVVRSEEHTSELQSLMRISYAVFCLHKKKTKKRNTHQATLI